MSDVANAPAPAAPAPSSAPAPAPAGEVAINQNPVNVPAPIRSEAPPAPEGDKSDKSRPQSRQEAIKRAFDRAEAKGRPGPAEAKPGHNNPPEETEKLDLKKPPRPEPHREGGKFAKAPERAEGQPAAEGQQATQPGQQQVAAQGQQHPQAARPQLPEHAPYREPPPRMADHAKAEWHAAPESVRGEVHRMATEFEGAYRHYRADHETMNSIRPFHQMAEQHGTTLERALTNYVGMEQKLRTDLVGGLDRIVNNLGLKTADGQPIGIRDVAWHILNQSPEQHQLVQQQNSQTAAQHQIGALSQEVSGLKHALQQMHTAAQFNQTRSAVDQYAEKHPRFDELGDLIERELQHGYDLDEAYRRADLLRPASPYGTTHAVQTRNPPAQTRPDKSIAGAPDSHPSNGSVRKPSKTPREAVQRALSANGGF